MENSVEKKKNKTTTRKRPKLNERGFWIKISQRVGFHSFIL